MGVFFTLGFLYYIILGTSGMSKNEIILAERMVVKLHLSYECQARPLIFSSFKLQS